MTGTDYYVTTSTGSYTDEMSSIVIILIKLQIHIGILLLLLRRKRLCNKIPMTTITSSPSSSSSSSSSSSACWDWLLYPPEIYCHLYIPSSSFIQQQQKQQDDDFDLLASLPTWLLALLYPSMKQIHSSDDENDNDQEISSLNKNHDEPLLSMNIDKKINHVSSNLSLSSENAS